MSRSPSPSQTAVDPFFEWCARWAEQVLDDTPIGPGSAGQSPTSLRPEPENPASARGPPKRVVTRTSPAPAIARGHQRTEQDHDDDPDDEERHDRTLTAALREPEPIDRPLADVRVRSRRTIQAPVKPATSAMAGAATDRAAERHFRPL